MLTWPFCHCLAFLRSLCLVQTKPCFCKHPEWNISLARASDERILLAKCLTGRDFLDKSIVHASSL